jgi:hypothetical protein
MADLAQAQGVRSRHDELVRTLDHLARENAATQQDNIMLVDQNTDLISHGNPHQKIRHHAYTRQELDQSRRVRPRFSRSHLPMSDPDLSRQNHLAVTSRLASSELKNQALEAELDAYRAVPPHPFTTSSSGLASIPARSRVSRPILHDVLSSSLAPLPPPAPHFTIQEEDEPVSFDQEPEPTTTGTSVSTSLSQNGDRRAGGVESEDEESRERAGAASARVAGGAKGRPSGGGVRMLGKMSVSELFG